MKSNQLMGIDNKLRTVCERWTRVMGYHRPVLSWNKGKQSEHGERKYFVSNPEIWNRSSGTNSDDRGWNSRTAGDA